MTTSAFASSEYCSILTAIAGQFEEAAFATDLEGVVLLFNPAAVRLFGLASEPAPGRALGDLLPPGLAGAVRQSIARVVQAGEPTVMQETTRHAGDAEHDVEIRFLPVRDGKGRLCAVAGTARRVAEHEGRKDRQTGQNTGQHLREAADVSLAYRRVIESLPDCINVKDASGRFLIANEATAELMKASSAADLIGKTDFDFFPPAVAEAFLRDERKILQDGVPKVIEQEAVHRDGTRVFLSTLKVPLRDEAGAIAGMITHNRDVTAQKFLERQLADNQRRFAGALTSLSDGLAVFDASGALVFCNRQFREMFPKTANICVAGRSVHEILQSAAKQGEFRLAPAALDLGAGQSPAELLRGMDGAEFQLSDGRWIEVRAKFAADGDCLLISIDVTERRKAASALKESEERYRSILEIAQEAWWEENLQTWRVKNSQRFCDMLGLGQDMLDCSIDEFENCIHPDDLELVKSAFFGSADKDDVDYQATYRLRHADGHYVWVEDHGRILTRDDQGHPVILLGSMTDITARKQVELALQESEERYRRVAEITQEAWWEEDVQSAELTNSSRFCEILGLGDDILKCSVAAYRELIHPEDRAHTLAAHERTVYEGADYHAFYRLRHADGHYLWVEDLARVVARDLDGRPTRLLGAITDITARRTAEIALQESEENFRRLFDDAPDAYLILDQKDGSALACNHAAARLLKGSRDQVIGVTMDKVSPPFQPGGKQSLEAAGERMRQILENGYLRFEWVHRRFNGDDFWVEVTATVGTFRQRPVLYITWREIGEIIAAKQAAEAASVAKSQFLSVMSHELRTPLNAITGMFQLIEMADASPRVREFAARGLDSSDHLLKLVEDVLDFSSIEAGSLPVVRAPFRLGAVLNEVSFLSAGKRRETVDFGIVADESLRMLELMGDALRLKQVLINLLGNAFKFTDHGSVVLRVTCLGGTPNEPLLEFAVEDTGVGLSPDQRDRLFQPFTQLDMSNVRRFGGTGLGLVISQRLVSLMGGAPITVESRPGLGSRFAFRLALPLASEVPSPDDGTATPAVPSRRLAGFRVLVVEDSESTRFALRLLLEAEGALVDEAQNGAVGVNMALAADAPYDAVLMDMQMPVKDGLEATRELRARGYGHPIMALTSSAFAQDRDVCLAAGMDDYISKPVKIDRLVGVLQSNRRVQTG